MGGVLGEGKEYSRGDRKIRKYKVENTSLCVAFSMIACTHLYLHPDSFVGSSIPVYLSHSSFSLLLFRSILFLIFNILLFCFFLLLLLFLLQFLTVFCLSLQFLIAVSVDRREYIHSAWQLKSSESHSQLQLSSCVVWGKAKPRRLMKPF